MIPDIGEITLTELLKLERHSTVEELLGAILCFSTQSNCHLTGRETDVFAEWTRQQRQVNTMMMLSSVYKNDMIVCKSPSIWSIYREEPYQQACHLMEHWRFTFWCLMCILWQGRNMLCSYALSFSHSFTAARWSSRTIVWIVWRPGHFAKKCKTLSQCKQCQEDSSKQITPAANPTETTNTSPNLHVSIHYQYPADNVPSHSEFSTRHGQGLCTAGHWVLRFSPLLEYHQLLQN